MDSDKGIVQTVLIVVAAFVIMCLLVVCVAFSVIFVLALMGPSIGNVFSNIITSIPMTPTPAVVP